MKNLPCLFLAAFTLVLPPLSGQETPPGEEETSSIFSASMETALAGSYAEDSGLSQGSAVELSLGFEGRTGSAGLRASARAAILQGSKTLPLWASLLASSSGGLGLFMSPAFDTSRPAPDWIAILSLEELSLTWSQGALSAEAGMGFANWGIGKAFSPADFFSEIDYSAASPRRKPNLLGRLTWFPGDLWRIDLVASPLGSPGLGGGRGPIAAARAFGLAGESLLLAASIGYKDPEDASPSLLGAVEASLDIGGITPYAEFAAAFPSGAESGQDLEWKLMTGLSAALPEASLSAEYLFAPSDPEVHRIFGQAAFKLGEWNSLGASALYSIDQASGSASLGLQWEALPGLSLSLSGYAARNSSAAWSLGLSASARSRL